MTNRKSHRPTRFRLVPKSWMTLKSHYALSFITRASFGALDENFYEDRPIPTATKMPTDSRFWQYKVCADIRGSSRDLCKYALDLYSSLFIKE